MKHTNTLHTTALIVGGGLSGLTLALMLAKHNIKTVLLDASTPPDTTPIGDMRTTAFMPSSVQYLKHLEVWDDVKHQTAPLHTMRIFPILPRNQMGSPVDFHASDAGLDALSHNLDNHILRTVLCHKIADCDSVEHLFNTPATDIVKDNGRWHVHTQDTIFCADIIVGADGRQSMIREKSGIASKTHDYKQTAIVCNVEHAHPHNNISTEMMYTDGAFTLVPLPDAHQSAVVWVEKSENVPHIIQNPETTLSYFVQKTQNMWGACKIISSIQSFPLNTYMAQTNVLDNIVLLGESHHGLTPVAAQGLNLSLRDSAVLSELLIDHQLHKTPIQSILQTYKNKRIRDVKSRSLATGMFHNMARASDPISLGIKTIGAGLFNRIPIARKTAIKAGLSFPDGTPKFMR